MSYTRPPFDAADASWSGAAVYARPTHDAADASFVGGVYKVYLGATALTGVYLGATPVQVYFSSTQVFG